MPQWIHDRAEHIRSKNPGMDKSQAFAIATQQAYAAGKAPKKYGTKEGRREAKQKYDEPKKHYTQTADPKSSSKTASIDSGMLLGFADELNKIAAFKPASMKGLTDVSKVVDRSKKALTTKPGSVSQAAKPEIPAPSPDHLGSMKLNPPPPITTGA
jgi:hypothetical protein